MTYPNLRFLWNTGAANRVEPSPAKKILGHEPSEDPSSSIENSIKARIQEWIDHVDEDHGAGFFGDGSDGDVVITTGVNLAKNTNYNNLTITSPGILDMRSFILRVRGTLTINSGGILRADGVDGSDGVGGTGGAGGGGGTPAALEAGAAGGAGGSGVQAGTAGTAKSDAEGGSGGAGGTSGPGGGAGGAANQPVAAAGRDDIFSLPSAAMGKIFGSALIQVGGGAGGGGGDSNTVTTTSGGGGGGGARTGTVCARNAVFNAGALFTALGGDGGDADGPGDGSGGAGGGGGFLTLVRRSLKDATGEVLFSVMTGDGRISVAGGAGGAGAAGGGSAPGAAGSAGLAVEVLA